MPIAFAPRERCLLRPAGYQPSKAPSGFQVRPRGLISPGKSASFRTLPMPSSSTIESELPKLPMIVAMARRRPSGTMRQRHFDPDVLGGSEGARTTVGADEFQDRTGRTAARVDVGDDISLRRPGRRRRGARRGQRRGTTIRQRKNRQSRGVASRSRIHETLTVGRPADGVNHSTVLASLGVPPLAPTVQIPDARRGRRQR